jgi:hypothetical protein
MCHTCSPIPLVLGAALMLAAGAANAFDPLGFYVGGAIGQSNVRSTRPLFDAPLEFVKHYTGWKLIAGLRPISLLGAELEYIDFGRPNGQVGALLQAQAQARATALFGLLYAPIPVPMLDIYGKLGLARLQTTVSATSSCGALAGCTPGSTRRSDSGNSLAYGGGAQLRFAPLAVRAEYERVSASGGDPDLFSLALTWSF